MSETICFYSQIQKCFPSPLNGSVIFEWVTDNALWESIAQRATGSLDIVSPQKGSGLYDYVRWSVLPKKVSPLEEFSCCAGIIHYIMHYDNDNMAKKWNYLDPFDRKICVSHLEFIYGLSIATIHFMRACSLIHVFCLLNELHKNILFW